MKPRRFRPVVALALALAGAFLAVVPMAASRSSAAAADGRLGVSFLAFDDQSVAIISLGASDPLSQVALSAPAGYTVNLGLPTGTRVGSVSGFLGDAAGASSPAFADGELVVDDPAKYLTNEAAQACAPGAHAAVWHATLSVLGQSFSLPIFVDPGASGDPGSPAFLLRLCPSWTSSALPDGVIAGALSIIVHGAVTPPTHPVATPGVRS